MSLRMLHTPTLTRLLLNCGKCKVSLFNSNVYYYRFSSTLNRGESMAEIQRFLSFNFVVTNLIMANFNINFSFF